MRVRLRVRSGARGSSTSHQHVEAPSIAPVEMYSRRREEGIGLRVGDAAAELGTGTFNQAATAGESRAPQEPSLRGCTRTGGRK